MLQGFPFPRRARRQVFGICRDTRDRVLRSKAFDLLITNSVQSETPKAALNSPALIVLSKWGLAASNGALGAQLALVRGNILQKCHHSPRTADLIFSQQSVSEAA